MKLETKLVKQQKEDVHGTRAFQCLKSKSKNFVSRDLQIKEKKTIYGKEIKPDMPHYTFGLKELLENHTYANTVTEKEKKVILRFLIGRILAVPIVVKDLIGRCYVKVVTSIMIIQKENAK